MKGMDSRKTVLQDVSLVENNPPIMTDLTTNIPNNHEVTSGDDVLSPNTLPNRSKFTIFKEKVIYFFDRFKTPILWIVTTIALILAMGGFAGNGIAFTFAKRANVYPLVIASFRIYGSIPILFFLVLIFEGVQRHTLREAPFMAFTALFGIFGSQFTFVLANYYVGASYCALFQPMPTIVTCLLGIIFKTETISLRKVWGWSKIIGIILAAIGSTAMVLFNAITSLQREEWNDIIWGNVLMVCNVFTWSIYLMILKRFFLNPKEAQTVPEPPKIDVNESTEPKDANDDVKITFVDEQPDQQVNEYDKLQESTPISTLHDTDAFHIEIQSPNQILSPLSKNSDDVNTFEEPNDEIVQNHAINDELKNKLKLDLSNLEEKQEIAQSVEPDVSVSQQVTAPPKIPYGPVNITFWMFCYASIGYIIIDIYLLITNPSVFKVGVDFILPTVYVASLGSAIPLCMVIYSTKVTSALFVASFSVLQLPFTVILAWLWFQQQLSIQDYIGGALIVTGLFCVIGGGFQEKREAEKKLKQEREALINK